MPSSPHRPGHATCLQPMRQCAAPPTDRRRRNALSCRRKPRQCTTPPPFPSARSGWPVSKARTIATARAMRSTCRPAPATPIASTTTMRPPPPTAFAPCVKASVGDWPNRRSGDTTSAACDADAGALAASRPDWQFVLVGPAGGARTCATPQHPLAGRTAGRAVGGFRGGLGSGVLPLTVGPSTWHQVPPLVANCLAAGVSVVATALPDISALYGDAVCCTADAAGFAAACARRVVDPTGAAAMAASARPPRWETMASGLQRRLAATAPRRHAASPGRALSDRVEAA